MANINYDSLVTPEDWSSALQTLLDEARAAISGEDQAKKLSVQQELGTFIKRSPVEYASLDGVAFKAGNNLFIAIKDDALRAIADRNTDLAAAARELQGVADKNKKRAKAIRFDNVISALDKAKSAAEELKEFERALDNPDQNLLGKIGALAEAIEALRRLRPQA